MKCQREHPLLYIQPAMRRIIPLLFLLTLMLMPSCRPRKVLSQSEMEDVLYELHRADGIILVAGIHYPYDTLRQTCYNAVLERHGITQAQFDSSLVWYTAHPRIFDKIYPKVMSRLKAEHDTVFAQKEAATPQLQKK